jgi:MOSC domain-containing protein YiiM
MPELEAALDHLRAAPSDRGRLELIVARPDVLGRSVLDEGVLDAEAGLVGDNWKARGSRHTDDGAAEPGRQLTLMNARAVDLFAQGDKQRWPEAGDQLYVDLDLSDANLPAGTRLAIGTGGAVVEVSELPHTGCAKFLERFGKDVTRFINTGPGRELHLRGINAFVIEPGRIAVGDVVEKTGMG